jgi:hypothetical protein
LSVYVKTQQSDKMNSNLMMLVEKSRFFPFLYFHSHFFILLF